MRLIAKKLARLKTILRTAYYKNLFQSFGEGSLVLGRITVRAPENISIGSKTRLNEGVIMEGRAKISIGDNVRISPRVIINTGYLLKEKFPKKVHNSKPVRIEDDVWIASGAMINPGVTIGKNSIVGAGAVVTKDVPQNTMVAGVPAKKI